MGKHSAAAIPQGGRIAILGASLETENRGVSALAASLVSLCRRFRPDAEVVFLAAAKTPSEREVLTESGPLKVPLFNVRLSPRAAFSEHLLATLAGACLWRISRSTWVRRFLEERFPYLRAVAHSAAIIDVWGGDSFSDIYGICRFLKGVLERLIPIALGRPLIFAPQTYGPYKTALSRRIAAFLLRRAHCVYARDLESLSRAQSLLGVSSRPRSAFCPDVAFTLPAAECPRHAIAPPIPEEADTELIAFNPSGLLFHGGYSRDNSFRLSMDYAKFACLMLERLLQDPGKRVLLVPHTYGGPDDVESDPTACKAALQALPPSKRKQVHLVCTACDAHQLKGLIGRCSLLIGSRMHACIAALSQGVPAIGVSYSPKFSGLYRALGLEELVVDARYLNEVQAVELVLELAGRAEKLREKVRSASEHARLEVERNFAELLRSTRGALCTVGAQ